MILLGGTLVVKHMERKVVVDDWIEIPMAAQTGVMLVEVRKQVDRILMQKFQDMDRRHHHQGPIMIGLDNRDKHTSSDKSESIIMMNGIVRLLSLTENCCLNKTRTL